MEFQVRLKNRPKRHASSVEMRCAPGFIRLHHSYLAHSQAQIDSPHNTHRAAKHDSLINRYPQETNQANKGPKLIPILHHRPQLRATICHHRIPRFHARFTLCIRERDIGKEHERVNHSTDRLIQHKLDKHICLAERCLGGVGFGGWVLLRGRGAREDFGGEQVFEQGLPDDVGRVGEDAEEGEFEHLGVV